MRLAIMQPYFLPYIGYFQLINAVDQFVVYDNIKYTKKGWINRNRILAANGGDEYITLPLRSDSDHLNIDRRYLSDSFPREKNKILRRIRERYRSAPHCDVVNEVLGEIFGYKGTNLFEFLYNSLQLVCRYLGISTPLVVSSALNSIADLKGKERVLAICREMGADCYVNPIGGVQLYTQEEFKMNGVDLKFLRPNLITYPQLGSEFVPRLSILDVMMFNDKKRIVDFINNEYSLV